MNACPNHPAISLPNNLTCPLCAQEARAAAYAVQRAKAFRQLAIAAQRLPGAALDPAGEASNDQ